MIQLEDITLVNMYTPNTGELKYIKKILVDLKEEINAIQSQQGILTPHCHQWIDIPDKIQPGNSDLK